MLQEAGEQKFRNADANQRTGEILLQGKKDMNTTTHMSGKKILRAAVTLAIVPVMGFSQDKAGADAPTPNAASGQPAHPSTGVVAPKGTADAGVRAHDNNITQRTQKAGGNPAAILLLIPVDAPEQNQWRKKGCWAKFHDDQNYKGDNLTLVGPVDMADMAGPFGIDWKGKISSVETGPKARVLVYDNENFKDLVATFKPGQKSPDVSKKMGFFDEFSSVKIACDNVKASGAKKGGE